MLSSWAVRFMVDSCLGVSLIGGQRRAPKGIVDEKWMGHHYRHGGLFSNGECGVLWWWCYQGCAGSCYFHYKLNKGEFIQRVLVYKERHSWKKERIQDEEMHEWGLDVLPADTDEPGRYNPLTKRRRRYQCDELLCRDIVCVADLYGQQMIGAFVIDSWSTYAVTMVT